MVGKLSANCRLGSLQNASLLQVSWGKRLGAPPGAHYQSKKKTSLEQRGQ